MDELVVCDKALFGKFAYYAHSEAGAPNKKENQDAVGILINDDYLCVALADGLGSCMHSATGAHQAVERTFEAVATCFAENKTISKEELCSNIIASWQRSFDDFGRSEKTTLRFLIVTTELVAHCCIGDGGTIMDHKKNLPLPIGQVALFSNETFCLHEAVTVDDFFWETKKYDEVLAIFLATDGIYNELIREKEQDFLHSLRGQMYKPTFSSQIEEWLSVIRKNNADDKTFILLALTGKESWDDGLCGKRVNRGLR